jgi:GTP-binding protein
MGSSCIVARRIPVQSNAARFHPRITCCAYQSVVFEKLRSRPRPNTSRGFRLNQHYHVFASCSSGFGVFYPESLRDRRSFSTAPAPEDDSLPLFERGIAVRRDGIRNIAVIAHVDHGKTTLVDKLLLASGRGDDLDGGVTSPESLNRLMDSGELEQERGITITSKVTRLAMNNTIINCVDTPGHADFAGEVDRILSMVDGVLLVVDAAEGPMTQTKYVLSRALALGLRPIVVLNKCDRPDASVALETGKTESDIFDLFDNLQATDEQMDYLTLFASARHNWVTTDVQHALQLAAASQKGEVSSKENSMSILLEAVIQHIPAASARLYDTPAPDSDDTPIQEAETFANDRFSLAAVSVGYDQYLGRTCMGRVDSGSVRVGDAVTFLSRTGSAASASGAPTVSSEITGMFIFKGIERIPFQHYTSSSDVPAAYAGDIITLTGVPDTIKVGDTLTSKSNPVPLPIDTPPLAPPTLAMDFGANNGPLAGKEGTLLSSSKIRDRLYAETDNNVTLQVVNSVSDSEKTVVYARGELQLGILAEQMRREGYEMIISPPRILTSTCPDTGKELEPFEEVIVDVDAEYAGTVVSILTGDRKGVLMEMNESSRDEKTRLKFEAPSRALLGFSSEIATLTKGSAAVHSLYIEDRDYAGGMVSGASKGKLVSNDNGKATLYALSALTARGELFVAPGDEVYSGMVIGENSKMGDMEVNPVRAKEKTNMRTHSKDEKVYLPPPKRRTIEELIGYMESDEIIEVTPQNVRLRKELLDSGARERAARSNAKAQRAALKK